jgi:starvation-inducible DNA-binding protein
MNQIGLSEESVVELVPELNTLLSTYSVSYINVRGFHWNLKGDKFFELHVKFEELYTNLQDKIDEVAERIVTLGATPIHSYTGYLSNSLLTEQTDVTDGGACVLLIRDSLKQILQLERQILERSEHAQDEGTNSLMSDYVREQEKLVWMYSAFLGG